MSEQNETIQKHDHPNYPNALAMGLAFGVPTFIGVLVLGPIAPLFTCLLVAMGLEWVVGKIEHIEDEEKDKANDLF